MRWKCKDCRYVKNRKSTSTGAKVNPDLVIYDHDNKPFAVRYEAVNAMLLNEFLKEDHMVQAQAATIAGLQKQIEALTASLQKVSAQVEVSKPARQTVLNNQAKSADDEVLGTNRCRLKE